MLARFRLVLFASEGADWARLMAVGCRFRCGQLASAPVSGRIGSATSRKSIGKVQMFRREPLRPLAEAICRFGRPALAERA